MNFFIFFQNFFFSGKFVRWLQVSYLLVIIIEYA
jgi:hypothetical protein